MVRRIEAADVRLDLLRPIGAVDVIHVTYPQILHDRVVTPYPWRRTVQHRLRQSQQLASGIEACQLDVQVGLCQLQGDFRADRELGEALQQTADITDSLPEYQLPPARLLRQGHRERDVVRG